MERISYDVVVAGGGPSGFIAALASARQGMRVAIIESNDFLGGMATAGMVAPISVFGFANTGRNIVGGIPWEFIKRLEAVGGALIEEPKLNISFDPELYKLIAQRMLIEAGVEVYFYTRLVQAEVEKGRISKITVLGRDGLFTLEAKAFVDSTGDATLAKLSGAPMMEQEGRIQPCSLYFMLSGVDTSTPLLRDAIHHSGKEGLNAVVLPLRERMLEDRDQLPMFGGPWFCDTLTPGTVLVNVSRVSVNTLDTKAYSEAAQTLREDVHTIFSYFKNNFVEFKDAALCTTAPRVGIRESRHIKGLQILNEADFLAGKQFPDTVALASHPVDIHDAKSDKQELTALTQPGRIPYGALVPQGIDNLLVAGRSISAETSAFASLRVQATAMALGQAAGTAAALVVSEGVGASDLNRSILIETLLTDGVILDF